jgi:hypothetical protein
MISRFHLIVCLVVILFFGIFQVGRGQDKDEDLLDKRIETFKVEESETPSVLKKLAYEHNIPIGIEVLSNPSVNPGKKIDLQLENKSVRELLQSIVEQDTRYEWKLVDGVINVFPKNDSDILLGELLSTQVAHFSVDNCQNRLTVRSNLLDVSSIKSKLEDAKVSPLVVAFTGIDLVKLGEKSKLNLSNKTLREVLNAIIKNSSTRFWSLKRVGDNNEFILLNF